jgi:hypothetical protein
METLLKLKFEIKNCPQGRKRAGASLKKRWKEMFFNKAQKLMNYLEVNF